MTEQWKPVVGFEGLYEVSDQGRVRSLPHTTTAVWTRDRVTKLVTWTFPGCIRKPICRGRYPSVNLSRGGEHFPRSVHGLVLEAFVGPRPLDMEARHLDGHRENASLTNLAWGTRLENLRDKYRHGTIPRGEKHARAKVTEQQVRSIRTRYARGGVKQSELAEEYGIAQTKISAIVRRVTWRHVS